MTIKQSSLTFKMLAIMSTLTALAFIAIPFTSVFVWFWKKFTAPFRWIANYDSDNIIYQTDIFIENHKEPYQPIDTDEAQINNPYGLDKDDSASFEWDEEFFGLN